MLAWAINLPLYFYFFTIGQELGEVKRANLRQLPRVLLLALAGMVGAGGAFFAFAAIAHVGNKGWAVGIATDLPIGLLIIGGKSALLRRYFILFALADDLLTLCILAVISHQHFQLYLILTQLALLSFAALGGNKSRARYLSMIAFWLASISSGFSPLVAAAIWGAMHPSMHRMRATKLANFVALPLFFALLLGYIFHSASWHLAGRSYLVLVAARVVGKFLAVTIVLSLLKFEPDLKNSRFAFASAAIAGFTVAAAVAVSQLPVTLILSAVAATLTASLIAKALFSIFSRR